MSDYVKGAQRGIGEAGEEPGLSLAGFGLITASSFESIVNL